MGSNIVNLLWILFILFVTTNNQLCSSTTLFNTSSIDNDESRVIGGTVAFHVGFEHQASIRLKTAETFNGFGYGHICGGSLISLTSVLTAAHCLYKSNGEMRSPSEFMIVLGNLNRYDVREAFESDVKSYVKHENFNLNTMQNDIAVMILKKNLDYSYPNIKPIEIGWVQEGIQNCKVSGWGKTYYTSNSGSSKLLWANVEILDRKQCEINYTFLGNKIYPGMLCAGKWQGGVDACQGDSGGPLTCSNRLVGIVSWGYGCGSSIYPGIYTNVSYFTNWIQNNIKQESTLNLKNGGSSNSFHCITTMIVFIVLIISL